MSDANPSARKSVRLKRQRDGSLRAHWYGQYREGARQREFNLNIKWRGTPPASGKWSDPGDARFEASRKRAEDALAAYVEEARHKGRVEHLTERLIESKTGAAVEYSLISDLPELWRNLGRESEVTEAHLGNCDAHFNRFISFMRARHPAARFLYEVTRSDATAFVKELRASLAPSTAQYGVRLLNKALSRFLPVGTVNPFALFVGRRRNGESGVVHRKPFTADELRAMLDAAREDRFMYPLIVTAACTGMRRGDVCRLDWGSVKLGDKPRLAVKTSKTDAPVMIPIFPPLLAVLEEIGPRDSGPVFPEAMSLLTENPDELTKRFKRIVARALDADAPPAPPVPVSAAAIEAEGLDAIRANTPEGARRERMLETFRRYAAGESVRAIEAAVGCPRSTVSTDLHDVERWTGKTFIRRTPGRHSEGSMVAAIARTTREQRKRGQKAASVRDWHALRTTFVTLALSAGVPVELVQIVTGHRTVEVVLQHYFRPNDEQVRTALAEKLPAVLTGGSPCK